MPGQLSARHNSPRRRLQRLLSSIALIGIIVHVSSIVGEALSPLIEYEVPATEHFRSSGRVFHDSGGRFSDYVLAWRAHLQSARVPIPSESFSPQVQLEWVAPFTRKVANDCSSIVGRALLIHGLYGSAYQMSDVADFLGKFCIESDVMLLPGHGTRPADINDVSADEYYDAVMTRMNEFRRSCRNCLVVGYSIGALLASLALMEDSRNIHGMVLFAPALATHFDVVSQSLDFLNDIYEYSPYSRQKMLPTHYSHESLYAARQFYLLTDRLYQRIDAEDSQIGIPSLMVMSEDDEVVNMTEVVAEIPWMFRVSPNLLIYSDIPEYWRGHLAGHQGAIEILGSDWSQLGIDSLTHYGLIYSPDNFLYGYSGIYGKCMEPSGFSCSDMPIDIRYSSRKTQPDPDVAMAASHPEFDRMMASVVEFISKHTLFER